MKTIFPLNNAATKKPNKVCNLNPSLRIFQGPRGSRAYDPSAASFLTPRWRLPLDNPVRYAGSLLDGYRWPGSDPVNEPAEAGREQLEIKGTYVVRLVGTMLVKKLLLDTLLVSSDALPKLTPSVSMMYYTAIVGRFAVASLHILLPPLSGEEQNMQQTEGFTETVLELQWVLRKAI